MKKLILISNILIAFFAQSQTCTLTVSKNPVCIGDTVWFKASSSFSAGNFLFLGPGGFSLNTTLDSAKLIVTSFANYGNYQCIMSSGTIACQAQLDFTVNPIPSPSILSSLNKGCTPFCTSFTCTSFPSAQSVNWQLGNSTTASGPTATACYYSVGIYTVNLFVTDINGCKGKTTLTVQANPNPIAAFTYTNVTGGYVNFSDQSTGSPISWDWYFEGTGQANNQNPTYTFSNTSQNYTVCLVVKNAFGCSDTTCNIISFLSEVPFLYDVTNYKIYPNPVNDKLRLSLPLLYLEIEIYDMIGNLILKQSNLKNENEIDISNLDKGIYFVRIIQNQKILQRRKIIKD